MPDDDTKRLPDEDFERLKGELRTRDGKQKELLVETGQRIDQVHFPVDAVIAVLTRMDDGASVEIATIGNEGLVGVAVAWGAEGMNPNEFATVQVPGALVSMGADVFRDEVRQQTALASLERYTQAFFTQVSQQVA